MNKHTPKQEEKHLGQVDSMVQDEYNKAMAEVKPENKSPEHKSKLSQEEEWKQLVNEPDPLAESDIYAGEK